MVAIFHSIVSSCNISELQKRNVDFEAMISRGSVVTDQLFDLNDPEGAENPFFASVKKAMQVRTFCEFTTLDPIRI